MTIIMAESVRVCFMMAKFSSKYPKSGVIALAMSASVMGAVPSVADRLRLK
jgi:hypothetical protein